MVGNSGSIYGLNYYNNESYSYEILNIQEFMINATVVNERECV
jgi:hypothetical protein